MLYLSKVLRQFSVNIVLPEPKWLLESENYIKWTILFIIIVLSYKLWKVRRQKSFVNSRIPKDIAWYITEPWMFKQKLFLSIPKELL